MDTLQLDLFTSFNPPESNKIMTLLDNVNKIFGKNTLRLGSQGHIAPYMKANNLSSAYTTCWKDLLKAQAN